MSRQLAWWVRVWRPDVIWISYADLVQYLPQDVGKAIVVYDCMDDFAAFSDLTLREARQFLANEAELVGRTAAVFVSSQYLQTRLRDRYGSKCSPVLVRNAFGGSVLPAVERSISSRRAGTRIGYVGNMDTPDWAAISKTLDSVPCLAYDFFGPAARVPDLFWRPDVQWHGVVAHEELAEAVMQDDCLVVPYWVNDRVLAQDSVKLYDYVNIGKPIVSVWYPEIERFRPFVEFYRTPDEFVSVLKQLIADGFPRKYTEEQRLAFLAENTWNKRAEIIDRVLKGLAQSDAPRDGSRV